MEILNKAHDVVSSIMADGNLPKRLPHGWRIAIFLPQKDFAQFASEFAKNHAGDNGFLPLQIEGIDFLSLGKVE